MSFTYVIMLISVSSAMDLINATNRSDIVDIGQVEIATTASSKASYKYLQLDITQGNSGCPLTTSSHCLRCNSKGCIKCPLLLVTDTRQCVDQCPSGYIDQWSAHAEFMGRICIATGHSGALMAALTGMFCGFLLCLSILAMAVMIFKRRRQTTMAKQKLIKENVMDRSDFLKQLAQMRPHAEYFLSILNDTRRQIRKLYLAGDIAAANSYRPIVRDLARILILLNRPLELIPNTPSDWNRLYNWSEQILERYKPKIDQLIDIFSTSDHMGTDIDEFDTSFMYCQATNGGNRFKQITMPMKASSNRRLTNEKLQKMHLFGSLISLHEFEEPQSTDPFGSNYNTLKNGNLLTDLNSSSLWLEDEFYKLGFRPQDEITTEL